MGMPFTAVGMPAAVLSGAAVLRCADLDGGVELAGLNVLDDFALILDCTCPLL